MSIHIRPLLTRDAYEFLAIRLEALRTDPSAFMTTLEEAQGYGPERYGDTLDPANEEQLMYGAFDGDALIGNAGIFREQKLKRRHVAWIQSVYVKPEYRGRTIGKQLVTALIAHARTMEGVDHLELSVEAGNSAAVSTYVSLGFIPWGHELCAARDSDGVEYDEIYMSLRI